MSLVYIEGTQGVRTDSKHVNVAATSTPYH